MQIVFVKCVQDEEGADPGLSFRRNDVALVWTVAHVVETALGTVKEMLSLADETASNAIAVA